MKTLLTILIALSLCGSAFGTERCCNCSHELTERGFTYGYSPTGYEKYGKLCRFCYDYQRLINTVMQNQGLSFSIELLDKRVAIKMWEEYDKTDEYPNLNTVIDQILKGAKKQ